MVRGRHRCYLRIPGTTVRREEQQYPRDDRAVICRVMVCMERYGYGISPEKARFNRIAPIGRSYNQKSERKNSIAVSPAIMLVQQIYTPYSCFSAWGKVYLY
jgi:hypothetical protein